jgi:hypothetical protein
MSLNIKFPHNLFFSAKLLRVDRHTETVDLIQGYITERQMYENYYM